MFKARKFSGAALILAAVLGGVAQSVVAIDSAKRSFLELSEGERYWWYEGAFRTAAHIIALSNKERGDCAAAWYLKDRDARRAEIEKEIEAYPSGGPTSTILALLERDCGPLASPAGS
jgi:hypothetical protein